MTFLLILMSKLRGCGPKAMPPPVRIGDLTLPARARPVPFWRYSLAVEPLTSPRVLVDAEPRAARGLLGAHDQVQRVDVGGHGEAGLGQLARLDFLAGGVDHGGHAGGALARPRPSALAAAPASADARPWARRLAAALRPAWRRLLGGLLGFGAAFSALAGAAFLRPASWRPALAALSAVGLGGRLLGGRRLAAFAFRPWLGLGGRLLGGRLLGGRLLLGGAASSSRPPQPRSSRARRRPRRQESS